MSDVLEMWAQQATPTPRGEHAARPANMTKLKDVGDVRAKSQLDDEDRRAIRHSKRMALMAVAAVSIAVLLPSADEFAPRATTADISSTTDHALADASMQPTALVSGSLSAQADTMPAELQEPTRDKLEVSADYPATGAAGFGANGLPNR